LDGDKPQTKFGDLSGVDRVRAMQEEIEHAIEEMSDTEGWMQFLDTMSRFHHYSFGNAMLILSQRRDATAVAGFNDWKNKFGRTVKKGEKAIWILAPMVKNTKGTDEESGREIEERRVIGFRAVPVFDVSQTEGDPLPESPAIARQSLDGAAPDGMVPALTSFIEAQGFAISYEPTGDAGGYTSFGSRRVVISSDRSEREQARTLAHEAAHIVLDHGKRIAEYHVDGARPDMEIEAESVAYIVGRQLGLDEIGGASLNYVDSWAQGDKDRVKKTANAVVAGARKILDAVASAEV
jgi:antirestriction protein ArdC